MQGPPDSQARSPMHMIPFEVLLVLEVEFVWYELEMEIALQTQGQMAKSHLERGTKFVFTAGQTAGTECLHSSWAKESPNFPGAGAGSPHLGDFTHKIVWEPRESSEIWDLCDIYVVCKTQSTSGASPRKDVGFLMPAVFLIF